MRIVSLGAPGPRLVEGSRALRTLVREFAHQLPRQTDGA